MGASHMKLGALGGSSSWREASSMDAVDVARLWPYALPVVVAAVSASSFELPCLLSRLLLLSISICHMSFNCSSEGGIGGGGGGGGTGGAFVSGVGCWSISGRPISCKCFCSASKRGAASFCIAFGTNLTGPSTCCNLAS